MNKKIKNVLIIGDSYSTFAGANPKGYAVYYSDADTEKTDVRRECETWWYLLRERTGINIVQNNSWSGSTVGYTGYNNSDCSHTSSFIYRMEKLYSEGFFEREKIDTVLVFGATNDSWANVELGNISFGTHTDAELRTVLPAICHITGRLAEIMKDGRVIYIINSGLKPEISEAVKLSAEHYGTEYIALGDINKRCNHPTVEGMRNICDAVYEYVKDSV
jgi:hypothetical protein